MREMSVPQKHSEPQHDVLAGELLLHQGGVRHQVLQDGRVDGQCGDGNTEGLRLQSLHLRRVQKRKRQLSRNFLLKIFKE